MKKNTYEDINAGRGFVYFATNPSMPGITKIGMTIKHPNVRLSELSSATGCPQPFLILAFFDTPAPQFTESSIHSELAEFRVNNQREFFNAPPSVLQETLRRWCDPFMGCVFSNTLDEVARTHKAGEEV